MGQREREDEAGAWHHVMNRGVARRTVFEGERDVRRFLFELARCVRAGLFEVHAYAVLATHYHLLLRSPTGRLSEGMRRAQNGYVRWFNRSRRRDGPLFRGRFRSHRVAGDAYLAAVVRYIDFNPVEARLVGLAERHPFGSARSYCGARSPPWLTRSTLESFVTNASGSAVFRPQNYIAVFHSKAGDPDATWIEARLRSSAKRDADLESMVVGGPPEVLGWMHRKAALADGTRVGLPVADCERVAGVVEHARAMQGAWTIRSRGPAIDGWNVAYVALQRLLCGATVTEIALRCSSSTSAVSRALARHRKLLASDREYASRIDTLVHASLPASPSALTLEASPVSGPRES